MKHLQFWILNSVVLSAEPAHALTIKDPLEFACWFGCEKPTESPLDLAKSFHELFVDGFLIAESTDASKLSTKSQFRPTEKEVLAGLSGDLDFDYLLTPVGGTLWERLTQADWSNYLFESFRVPSSHCWEATVISQSLPLVEEAINYLMGSGQPILSGSETWSQIEDWPATYWKSLPGAIKFECLLGSYNPKFHVNDKPVPWPRAWYANPHNLE